MTTNKTFSNKAYARLALGAVAAMLFAATPFAGAQASGDAHRGMQMRDGTHHARGGQHGDRMFRRIPDATPEQKARLTAIAKAARADLQPLRAKERAARAESMRLLSQPTIDRAALERVRAEQSALHETRSKRMSQAMADAAEVLTPAQRAKIAERMKERRARMQEKRAS